MPRGGALLLASLLLAATLGLGSPVKEKRGWTLNSAGYLLGPHAVDNHRSFHDRHSLAGKRDLQPEDTDRAGGFDRPLPGDDRVSKMIDLLTLLHLREPGALEPMLPAAVSSEDAEPSVPREPGTVAASREVRL